MSSRPNLNPVLYKATVLLVMALLCACDERVRSNIERAHAPSSPLMTQEERASPLEDVPAPPEPVIVHAPTNPRGIVVMMHGYNSTHHDFEPVARLAMREGLVGVSVPAPIVNAPSRYQWERDDLEATHRYLQSVLQGGEIEASTTRVWLAGFSQGGMYAALLTARYPQHYEGALAIAPAGWASVPGQGEECPGDVREVVVFTGEAERPAFAEKTAQVVAFLKSCSMLQEVVTHPGGHQFPADWPERFGAIFTRWAS